MQAVVDEHRVRMSGLLLVDKPAGITSHDVVSHVRRAAATKRVGHAGTLDPFATGLLVLGVGHVTRLLPYLDAEPKVYEATVRFGFETNTDDATGLETARASMPDWDRLSAAIGALTGDIAQTPPAFSAKHVNGERAYALARRGDDVALEPVRITVHAWNVVARSDDSVSVVITCAGGTYVRALARDLGRLMGSAAHCATLRRVRSGACSVADAVPLELLARGAVASGSVALRSPLQALRPMAVEAVASDDEASIRLGRAIPAHASGELAALVRERHHDDIVAIAVRDGDRWQPRVVLPLEPGTE